MKNLLSISIWVCLRLFQGTVLFLQLGALGNSVRNYRVCPELCVVRYVNYWMRRCSCLFKHILSVWSNAWNEDWTPLPWDESAPQSFNSIMRSWQWARREGVAAGIALQLAWRLPWICSKVIPGFPGLWWKHGMCITTTLCPLSNSINPRTCHVQWYREWEQPGHGKAAHEQGIKDLKCKALGRLSI